MVAETPDGDRSVDIEDIGNSHSRYEAIHIGENDLTHLLPLCRDRTWG